jgi:hypothetical protein
VVQKKPTGISCAGCVCARRCAHVSAPFLVLSRLLPALCLSFCLRHTHTHGCSIRVLIWAHQPDNFSCEGHSCIELRARHTTTSDKRQHTARSACSYIDSSSCRQPRINPPCACSTHTRTQAHTASYSEKHIVCARTKHTDARTPRTHSPPHTTAHHPLTFNPALTHSRASRRCRNTTPPLDREHSLQRR